MSYWKSSKSSDLAKCSKELKSSVLRHRPLGHAHGAVQEPKRRRVWKACERCKVKKIKCDAAAPCKRCKEDGMICVTSSRRRTELASVPRGYAEVLENTHFTLVASIEKLYSMLRNGESWLLDEPQTNEHGMPIVHDVAKALGCLRAGQDNVWAISSILQLGKRILTSEEEHIEGYEKSFSPDDCLCPRFERIDSMPQVSETPSSPLEQENAVYQHQEENWSSSKDGHLPTHQAPQQNPAFWFVSSQIRNPATNSSNQYPDQAGSSSVWKQLSDSEVSSFDTTEAAQTLLPDRSGGVSDWALWSDDTAWKFFTDL